MRSLEILKRPFAIVGVMAAAAILSGAPACVDSVAGGGAGEPTTAVILALTTVPTDAKCIRLSSDLAGRRTTLLANLTAGAASFTTTFTGLPVGSQQLWADVFNATCTSVTSATVATWLSDTVTVVTSATTTPSISLVLRRPANLGVGVDFCSTSPCTCSTGNHLCSGLCVSNTSVNSCGTSCTACPVPSNGVATCNGTSCGVVCDVGFHSCGGGTCAADGDVTKCGPGPSCFSCAQPNAIAACGSGTCANTCRNSAYLLSCPAVGGKPNCSEWQFDSGVTEGWILQPVAATSNASAGALTSSMSTSTTGSGSLAIPFNNGGDSNKYVEIAVKLCAGGNGVNLTGKTVRFSFHMDPPEPTGGGYNYVMSFATSALTGGGGFGDFNGDSSGTWKVLQTPIPPGNTSVAGIGFHLQATEAYSGTYYIDNITLQ
jgi:hypothetical protein